MNADHKTVASRLSREESLPRLFEEFQGLSRKLPFDELADVVHERLLANGFSESEALEFNKVLRQAIRPATPRFTTFEVFLTRYCNLDCPYCFVHSKNWDRMSESNLHATIDFILKERDPERKLGVIFMGGEPTAAYPLIKEVVHAIEEVVPPDPEKLRFDITTNGTLLTEEMMSFFAHHNIKVLISLDGDRATHDLKRRTVDGHGTFDEVVKRLAIVKRYQPYLGSKMTPTAETVHNLLHDVQTLVDLGFRRLLIGPASGVEWPEPALAILAEQIRAVLTWRDSHPDHQQITLSFDEVGKETSLCGQENRWGCRAGRTGIAIDVDGDLYPCSKIIGTDKPRGGHLRLGDVFNGIVEEDSHLRLNGYIPTKRTICWSCGLRGACLGGCYAANIEANNSPWIPAPNTCGVADVVLRVTKECLAEKEDLALRASEVTRARSSGQTDVLRPH